MLIESKIQFRKTVIMTNEKDEDPKGRTNMKFWDDIEGIERVPNPVWQ